MAAANGSILAGSTVQMNMVAQQSFLVIKSWPVALAFFQLCHVLMVFPPSLPPSLSLSLSPSLSLSLVLFCLTRESSLSYAEWAANSRRCWSCHWVFESRRNFPFRQCWPAISTWLCPSVSTISCTNTSKSTPWGYHTTRYSSVIWCTNCMQYAILQLIVSSMISFCSLSSSLGAPCCGTIFKTVH